MIFLRFHCFVKLLLRFCYVLIVFFIRFYDCVMSLLIIYDIIIILLRFEYRCHRFYKEFMNVVVLLRVQDFVMILLIIYEFIAMLLRLFGVMKILTTVCIISLDFIKISLSC